MSVWRLVLQELKHRKLNTALALLSVVVAVACLVGAVTTVQADRLRAADAGRQLQDEMRKHMRGLGFNIVVLAEDEDLQQFALTGIPQQSMSESLVDKLANSDIVTINHLLPIVTRKVEWPETGKTIVLTGTRGEVPQAHRDPKKPLQEQVPRGTMIVGYQLARQLDLKVGDPTKLLGAEFQITKVHPERGDVQDTTVWINLQQAQELLGMENLVNAILALECNCQTVDRIGEIREDLAAVLPGTQVIERESKALARAKARNQAATAAQETLERHKDLAAWLVPVVLIACGVWIGCLFLLNVRQRSGEIGILRAVGLKTRQVLGLFLGKAVLIGVVGAVLGFAMGLLITMPTADLPASVERSALFLPWLLAMVLVLAPVLSAVASWIPAVLAARQDPAMVLQGE